MPVAQYPDVAPPTVQVTATYPGANAKTTADNVATPIEQEVNGVERMLYMSSKCTNDGQMNLDVTFELGTNLDTAQVLVQNRVAVAEAKLPEEVKRIGVTTKKKSPSILLCVNLISERPDGSFFYDQLYLSNFATLSVKDDLARIKGVGDVAFLGPRDYSMRVWLDPDKLAARDLTASDVINAVREQNARWPPAGSASRRFRTGDSVQFQLPINTAGPADHRRAVREHRRSRRATDGGVVHFKDVVRETSRDADGRVIGQGHRAGREELRRQQLSRRRAVRHAGRLPVARLQRARHGRGDPRQDGGAQRRAFPRASTTASSTTRPCSSRSRSHSVIHTLIEAFILVFIVVLVFLQNWRATIIPMVAVPVSLIGTFAVMAMLGFSLNNLSLFGLVLAIGIVVDDAIVVVENVERWLAEGLSPRDASRKAMDEVTGPVIAIALVLCAVFVPTAFMAGISGQFYKQFALTIAASTIISAFNSLTLSPALAALLLKPHGHGEHGHVQQEALPRAGIAIIGGLIAYFFLLAPIGHLVRHRGRRPRA